MVNSPAISNKKGRFHYTIMAEIVAGMVLTGAEVKSLRAGKGSLQESYCFFRKNELFIKSMYIAPYEKRGFVEVDPVRVRKLLLKQSDLQKWNKRAREKGYALVPLRLFFSKKGWAKLEIGLGKGKKKYDKRQDLRKKEDNRMLQRLKKRAF